MRRFLLTMIIAIVAMFGFKTTFAGTATTHSVIVTNSVEAFSPVMTTHSAVVTSSVAFDTDANIYTFNLTTGDDGIVVRGEPLAAAMSSANTTYDDAMAKIGAKEHGVQSPVSAPDGSRGYPLKYPQLGTAVLDTAY